jgi:hypothetical protein
VLVVEGQGVEDSEGTDEYDAVLVEEGQGVEDSEGTDE